MNNSKMLMMIFVVVMAVLCAGPSLAQDQMLKWYHPGRELDFTNPSLPPFPGALYPPNTGEISNGICYKNGATLFYIVDGHIYDAFKSPMSNGYLLGIPSREIAIVPIPNDCRRFYVIYILGGSVLYSIVDMTLNNGAGGVNIQEAYLNLGNYSDAEGLAVSVPVSNEYFLYIVTSRTIERWTIGTSISSQMTIAGSIWFPYYRYAGSELELSNDGSKLAGTIRATGDPHTPFPNLTYVVDIDANGYVSHRFYPINSDCQPEDPLFKISGLEFDASGTKLFISAEDLCPPNPATTHGIYWVDPASTGAPVRIAGSDDLYCSQLEKGRDGLIYASSLANVVQGINPVTPSLYGSPITGINVATSFLPGFQTSYPQKMLPDQIDGLDYSICCCAAPPAGMVAWWPLDETAGPTATEIVGWNAGSYVTPTPDVGMVGNALRFHDIANPSAGDVLMVPHTPSLNFDKGCLSIDAWVYFDRSVSPGYGEQIMGKGNAFVICVGHVSSTMGFHIHLGGYHYHSQVGVPLQRWTHIAFTVEQDGSAVPVHNGIKYYINGQMVYAVTPNMIHNLSCTDPLTIGGVLGHWQSMFEGLLDEVEIFDRVLTPSEVLSIWAAGRGGKCKPEIFADRPDGWIKDDPAYDVGNEPNDETKYGTGGIFWASEDIWVRNKPAKKINSNPDRFLYEHCHEDPWYSKNPNTAPWVYVKVINRGDQPVSGTVRIWWGEIHTPAPLWPTEWTEISPSYPGNTTITNLARGEAWVVHRQWQDLFPNCKCQKYFQLLARFESDPLSNDPIGAEVPNVWINVYHNNNIAWKKVTFVPMTIIKKSECMLALVGGLATDGLINLEFSAPRDERGDPFTNHGQVYVDLGPVLDLWQGAGGGGQGFTILESGLLLIRDTVATVTGIPMDSGRVDTICVQFERDDPPLEEEQTFSFNVIQYFEDETNPYGGFTYYVNLGPPTSAIVKLEKTHNTLQGHYESFSITIENSDLEMGGFDFLIAYDAAALAFNEAQPGDLLDTCDWEYFTYRYGANGNCGDACPSGLLRLIALAETNNGPNHPSCYGPPDTDPHELARMTFYVTNDRTYDCQFVPIYFFWGDCADNSVSSPDGQDLYIDRAIYDFEGNLIWHEEDDDLYPEDARIPFVGAPDYCLNPDPEKPSAIRLIEFINGGIDIICADSIDVRGDINVNGLGNEIADAVMFTNYFINGLSSFGDHQEASIAASDANADGIALSVADLVYLVRVITGDAQPYPKLTPNAHEASVNLLVNHSAAALAVNSPVDIGGGYFVFEHRGYSIGEPQLINGASGMTLKYSDRDGVLRVLVYSMEKNVKVPAGAQNVFVIPIEGQGNVTLTEIQLSDYNGNLLTTKVGDGPILPAAFALHQNYPNPFNATTTITYELPAATHVKIEVLNVLGQRVAVIFDADETPGVHVAQWNGADASGTSVASGVYVYRLTAGDFSAEKKMVLMK